MLDKQVFGKLLNTRSGRWTFDDDLFLVIQAADQVTLDASDQKILDSLKSSFVRGDTIAITSEHMRLVYNVSKKLGKLDGREVKQVADGLRMGAARLGVHNEPWIKDALNLLYSLMSSPITIDDDDDDE